VLGWLREGSTLRATSTACVLDTMPTTTEPCFTASDAYSTWKMRPWGELGRLAGCSSRRGLRDAQSDRVIVIVISEHFGGFVASALCRCVVLCGVSRRLRERWICCGRSVCISRKNEGGFYLGSMCELSRPQILVSRINSILS